MSRNTVFGADNAALEGQTRERTGKQGWSCYSTVCLELLTLQTTTT